MRTVETCPYKVLIIENTFISMGDGTNLAARIWLPEGAENDPVPAIMEYIPYRKRDLTWSRDTENFNYLAGHGYACLRVDMRGSGDSEGLTGIMDEPAFRAWSQDSVPPYFSYKERSGRWISEPGWPSSNIKHTLCSPSLGYIRLPADGEGPEVECRGLEEQVVQSPLGVGLSAGKWCSYAAAPDLPGDQREPRPEDDELWPFDEPVVGEPLEMLSTAPGEHSWIVHKDMAENMSTLIVTNNQGCLRGRSSHLLKELGRSSAQRQSLRQDCRRRIPPDRT